MQSARCSRALLPAVGLADRAVHVEDQFFERLRRMDLVDPLAGELHQRREVAAGTERLGLEASHYAHGSGFACLAPLPARPPHGAWPGRRQTFGIIHVFVSCQSAVDRLSQQRHEQVLLVACPGVNRSAALRPFP